MQNFDAIAVILCGAFVGSWFYPYYERRTGRRMKISTKFIIGNTFGTLGIIYALFIDIYVVREFEKSGRPLNILWQAPSFICIGFGEIFVVSSAFNDVFRSAPKNLKALSSAVNNFICGWVPQYLIKLSVMFTSQWFVAADGSDQLNNLPAYATANTLKYFGLLVGISTFGLLINMLPAVDRFLERMLAAAEKADKLAEKEDFNDANRPFNLTDNKTERVEETNHTETMATSSAEQALLMRNGH
jgi:dipeptide/tripeptide permease